MPDEKSEFGVAFQTDKPLSDYGPLARTVEEYGFDVINVYSDMLYQPAWLPLLEMARHTSRIRLGPAGVTPFLEHPVSIAGNIALLDEASRGRAFLGLVRGGWMELVGGEPQRPIQALREAFRCIRHLLQRKAEPFPADFFPLLDKATLHWNSWRPHIPFLLGSWGAKTIRACLPEVEEVKVGGTGNPAVVRHLRSLIQEASAGWGEGRPQVRLVVGAVTIVDEDGQAARRLARREVAMYLPIVGPLDPQAPLEPERLQHIRQALAEGDLEAAADCVSDPILERFTFSGTPAQVAEHAARMLEAGAQRVEFGKPHGLVEKEGLRLLGEKVLPILRRLCWQNQ